MLNQCYPSLKWFAHIFERFSRVNTSHSRVFGGSFNGLMIAESLALMLGGAVISAQRTLAWTVQQLYPHPPAGTSLPPFLIKS